MKKGCMSAAGGFVAFVILGAVLWVVTLPQTSFSAKSAERPARPVTTERAPAAPVSVPASAPVSSAPASVASDNSAPPTATGSVPHRVPVPYSYGSKVRLISEKSIFLSSGGKEKLVPGTEGIVRGSSGDTLTVEVMGETFNIKRSEVQADDR